MASIKNKVQQNEKDHMLENISQISAIVHCGSGVK
jgi:hypothetical protein